MLLKRSLVLAVGVFLFIAAFIIYFDLAHKNMEDGFQAEREKFGVEGLVLTSSTPPAAPSMTHPRTADPDTNTLIGPVPPPAAPAPSPTDSSAAPAPSAPDTNSAPSTTPASTMNEGHAQQSPFFQLASYQPGDDALVQLAGALPGATVESVAPAATNTPMAAAPLPTPPPATESGTASGNTVIVLLYHQFKAAGVVIPTKFQWTMNVDVFQTEMKYIHDNGYNVISMEQLLKFIKHEGTVPPHAVCITIDDGYKSAIVYAAPILKQYGYPWTFFIYPDFVTVAEGSGAVSWNDLLELQKEGIDIESHSMTHPNLKLHHQKVKGVWHDFTPDEYAAWLNNETAGSKTLLEQKMGKPITCFAYPYGEHNKQVEDAAIAAGYEAIFTVDDNPVHPNTKLTSIGRYTITQGVEKNFAGYLHQGALWVSMADPAAGATTSNPRPVITATLGYPGTLDPKTIETSVRDFGDVRHDFDPTTNTLRLYLPRDLIAPVVLVSIRVEDAISKHIMVANWRFNYEPGAGANAPSAHAPIAPQAPVPAIPLVPASNAPIVAPVPQQKSGVGTAPVAPSSTAPVTPKSAD